MKHNVERLMETRRHDCVGCHACLDICPAHAVSMVCDREGFLYPTVDEKKCTGCGACLQACQISNHHKLENNISVEAYTCMNRDTEERLASSSGGAFIVLAKYVIEKGGVVFGASFDEKMNLRHTYASDVEGLRQFMGSKYLQSTIGHSYAEVRSFLQKGRLVLFSGTPCQIHGLKLFLGKEYDNLIAVDLACHGVPSPAVFHKYLTDLEKAQNSQVVDFNFRSKNTGWKNFSSFIRFQTDEKLSAPHDNCPFMKGFLSNLYLRPSCYRCINKGDNRYSDITMGDYWGVGEHEPEWDDDKGTSVLFVRTEKGNQILEAVHGDLERKVTDKDYAESRNIAIAAPVSMNPHREDFFRDFESKGNSSISLARMIKPYIPQKTWAMRIKAMIPKPLKGRIKRMLGGLRIKNWFCMVGEKLGIGSDWKFLVKSGQLRAEIKSIMVDLIKAAPGDLVALVDAMKKTINLPNQMFWAKMEMFLKGIHVNDETSEDLCTRLAEMGKKEEYAFRLVEIIDRVESEQKIRYLIRATLCFMKRYIDGPTYFRICHAIQHTLEEDLSFLKEHMGEENLLYSSYVQGLLTAGLMHQSVIAPDDEQRYSFVPFATEVYRYALIDDAEMDSEFVKKSRAAGNPRTQVEPKTATNEQIDALFYESDKA